MKKYTVVGLTIDYDPQVIGGCDDDLGRTYVELVEADDPAGATANACALDPEWRAECLVIAVFEGFHIDYGPEGGQEEE